MEYVLVKMCPDGQQINVRFSTERELRTHLEAMWKYCEDYSLIAIYLKPEKE